MCGYDKQHLDLTASHHHLLSKVLSHILSNSILTKPNQSINVSEDYRGLILKHNEVNPAGKQTLYRTLHFSMNWVVTIKKEQVECPDSFSFVPSFILAQWFSDYVVHKNYCSEFYIQNYTYYGLWAI